MRLEDSVFPPGDDDEHELLLQWLDYLRGAVLRNVGGLDEARARWTPDDRLISLLGIVHHLTNVERRWIDGGFGGVAVDRSEREFAPGPELTLAEAVSAYRLRAITTDDRVRQLSLNDVSGTDSWAGGKVLRWVVLHLINETARHAGHADAIRELLDGTTGE